MRAVSGTIVEFFRAVPVLLMMIFFYLGLGQLQILDPSDVPLVAVVLGLTFYNGSVFAELVRSGVHGLPRGQREAALAVGLRDGQSLRLVEVPQALIAMLPAIASQLVVILKDTALGLIVTYPELLDAARRFGSGNGNILQALVVAALIFIVINYGLTRLADLLAGRVGNAHRGQAARGGAEPGGRDRERTERQPAVALARISRTTVTVISPGYARSASMCRAIATASCGSAKSSTSDGSTMTRTSRPADMASARRTPACAATSCSSLSMRSTY